jgi:hypothetical protein
VLSAHIGTLVRAIQDNDEAKIEEAILHLSKSRRVFAPLGFAVGAFVMLFNGLGRDFPWILAGSSTLIPRHGCI